VTTPKRRFVENLSDGEPIDEVYLVGDKQLRANRNGNLYLQLQLRDRTGSIDARLWNAGEPLFRSFEPGDFLEVRGKVQLFQGALQVVLSSIERVGPERVALADFLPHTDKDVAKLQQTLQATLRKLSNLHLRALAECFLMDQPFLRDFCRAPAGTRVHHAYIGGLLEHVVNMLEVAERILPLYPKVDRDLLLMGVFLHDIGKVRELSFDRMFGYTDEGQLVGHLVIGVQMLHDKVKQVPDLTGEPFPPGLLLRLEHMILSHHGSYEFGSPKLPMTPEAIALHYLDNLDAKVHTFVRDIEEDRNSTSAWTPFNQSLQRRLFKAGVRGQESGAREETEDLR
jgi:3'-5' exoribonuclease